MESPGVYCLVEMRAGLAAFIDLVMPIDSSSQPPQILQIVREPVKPGCEAAYRELEEDTARIAAALGCPHPYLAIESLTGAKEVWWFNGYTSPAEQKQVYEDYAKNTRLMAALQQASNRKASLTLAPIEVFANYRQDLSIASLWLMGQGRFLVITVTRGSRPGTVFEAADGARFIVTSGRTRKEADALTGPQSTVFAVRPSLSFPAEEWIARDPQFWQPRPTGG